MRGKQSALEYKKQSARITPADAGKPFFGGIPAALGGDHPRGCGENSVIKKSQDPARGSPPRMRGKLQLLGIA